MEKLAIYKEGMSREEKLQVANEHKEEILSFFLKDKRPEAEMNQEFPRVEMTDFQLDPKNNGAFKAKLELINNDFGDKDSIRYFDISLNEKDEYLTSIENTYLSPEEIEMKERESFGEQVDAVESEYDGGYEMSEILEAYQEIQSKKADLFQEVAGQANLMGSVVIDADSNQKYLFVKDTQTEREYTYPINEADLSVKVSQDPKHPEYSLNTFLTEEHLQEVTDSINMFENVRVKLSDSELQNLPEEVVENLLESYDLANEKRFIEVENQTPKMDMQEEPSMEAMSSAYANALIFQESFGIHSDTVEWENYNLNLYLKENDPAGLEYFKSLKELDRQYNEVIHKVENWNIQPEIYTKDELYKKERFSQFINQLEVFQEGPISSVESDIMKATYTKDEEYHVIFGLDFDNTAYGQRTGLESANHQVYDAVYKGGEIVSLQPENEALMEHLQTYYAYPDNVITENDKAYVLSVSNSVTKNIDEYQALITDLKSERANPVRDFEKSFNEAIHKESPVDRLEALRDLRQDITKSFEKFNRMDEILIETHPKIKDMMDKENFRSEIEYDMDRLYQKFDNPNLFRTGKYTEIRTLREVATHISSIDLQEVRKQGLEGELFKKPEQAIIFSRFDVNKPFNLSISAESQDFNGASGFFQKLHNEQLKDPKEIVEHYISIQESVNTYMKSNNYSQVDMIKLSEYSERSLEEAVKVTESSFEKDFPASPELNLKPTISVEFNEQYEGEWIIEEVNKLAEPLKAVSALNKDESLTVLNLANASGLKMEQESFWTRQAVTMIENHAGRPMNRTQTEDGPLVDSSNVRQSITKMQEGIMRNGENPRIEKQMLNQLDKWDAQQGITREPEKEQEAVKTKELQATVDMER